MGSGGLFAKLLSCLLYLSIGKTLFMHIEMGMVADFVTSFINSWTSEVYTIQELPGEESFQSKMIP